jgi:hypothetical protein
MILLQVGFGSQLTKWIMGCVTSPTYVVLINGDSTDFFRSGRGLRQGCPLSPFIVHSGHGGTQSSIKEK